MKKEFRSYELFDLEGRIVRPINKLNEYIEDSFSITAKEWATNPKISDHAVLKKLLGDKEIGVAKKIVSYNTREGAVNTVGIIAIRFAPKSLAIEATKNSKAYLEAMITSCLVAILFFGIVYYLTTRPIDEMRFQIEQVMRGKRKNLESRHLMSEIEPLRDTINSILQRLSEFQNENDDNTEMEMEDDTPYVDQLGELLKGAGVAAMVLNSEKRISFLNTLSEDLIGLRENVVKGEELLEVTREQGIAATIIDLCDKTANDNGNSQEGEYELSGKQYSIFTTALMGRDSFAKGFYVTFIPMD